MKRCLILIGLLSLVLTMSLSATEYLSPEFSGGWEFNTPGTGSWDGEKLVLESGMDGVNPFAVLGNLKLDAGVTYTFRLKINATPSTKYRVYVENNTNWQSAVIGPLNGTGEWNEIEGEITLKDITNTSHIVVQLLSTGKIEVKSVQIAPKIETKKTGMVEYLGEFPSGNWVFAPPANGKITNKKIHLAAKDDKVQPYAGIDLDIENNKDYEFVANVKVTENVPYRIYVENSANWEGAALNYKGSGEFEELNKDFKFFKAVGKSHVIIQLLGKGELELSSLKVGFLKAKPKSDSLVEYLGVKPSKGWVFAPPANGKITNKKIHLTSSDDKVQPYAGIDLDIENNKDYEFFVKVKARPGVPYKVYIENAANWEGAAINGAGNGEFESFTQPFKFQKASGKSHIIIQLLGKGELEVDSVTVGPEQKRPIGELSNGDFSQGDKSWKLAAGAKIINGTLHIEVPEANKIVKVIQPLIRVEPSKTYKVTYDAKGIKGKGDANTFHWFKIYPVYKETPIPEMMYQSCFDQTQKKNMTFMVPPRNNSIALAVEVRGPAAVSFDNFVLSEVIENIPPAEIQLDLPFAYRDGIFSNTPERQISGVIKINSSAVKSLKFSVDGHPVNLLTDNRFSIDAPVKGKSAELAVQALDKDNKIINTAVKTITAYQPQANEVAFNHEGFAIVNGKRFFPIGHTETSSRGDLDFELASFKEAGFNVISIRATAKTLDTAQKHGMMILKSMPQELQGKTPEQKKYLESLVEKDIRATKDHPALLGYFGSDEPTWRGQPLEPMIEIYNLIRKIDPYRPVWVNEAPVITASGMSSKDFKNYARVADTYGVDIYPVPEGGAHGSLESDRGLTAVGKYTDLCHDLVENRKPIWMILQAFAWQQCSNPNFPPEKATYPTWEQSRFMAYNAIAHGATGIIYHYLAYGKVLSETFWRDLRRVTRELSYMSDIITADTVVNTTVKVDNKEIRFLHKQLNKVNYYLITNESAKPVLANFSGVPADEKLLNVLLEDNRKIEVKNGNFSLNLPARGVIVLSVAPFKSAKGIYDEEHMRPYNTKVIDSKETVLLKKGNWIWYPGKENQASSRAFFRRSFDSANVVKAEFFINVDDLYKFKVNGTLAGSDLPGQYAQGGCASIERYDITKYLKPGENTVSVEGWDGGCLPCGFYGVIKLETSSGQEIIIPSDESWIASTSENGDGVKPVIISPLGSMPWGFNFVMQDGALDNNK